MEIKESMAHLAALKSYTIKLEQKYNQLKEDFSTMKSRLMLTMDNDIEQSTSEKGNRDSSSGCGCQHV